METLAQGIVAVGWLAIAAILSWSVVESTRKLLNDDRRLPIFTMIGRRGLTLRQVEEAVGMNEFAHAVRRCAHCVSRPDCGPNTVSCPNEAILRQVQGTGGAP